MQYLPPIPPWEGLHPIVVHFPIGLLLAAPIFVILAVVFPKGKSLADSALVMMVLGTLGAILAVATGEAAGEAAETLPLVKPTLERHEELAETARNVFIGLTALYAGIALWARWRADRLVRRNFVAVNLLFLILYGAGSLVLANAAHEGGLLVHRLGVHAPTAGDTTPPASDRAHRDDD